MDKNAKVGDKLLDLVKKERDKTQKEERPVLVCKGQRKEEARERKEGEMNEARSKRRKGENKGRRFHP